MTTIAVTAPPGGELDRRKFLSGAWGTPSGVSAARRAIATIHVQARPDRLAEVEQQLGAIGGCRISRHSRAKLRLDIGLSETRDLAAILNTITAVPDVLGATLAGSLESAS